MSLWKIEISENEMFIKSKNVEKIFVLNKMFTLYCQGSSGGPDAHHYRGFL
jgi:hypothetical protein